MDVSEIAHNIEWNSAGYWQSRTTEPISYTENGHRKISNDETHSFWFRHRRSCLSVLIDKELQAPVLDVGGGNGVFTEHLEKHGLECVLVEPGQHAVHNALGKGVKHVICSSLFQAQFRRSTFKSVVLLDVLEHIKEDKAFLKEIHKLLVHQGKLILTVPALPYLYSKFDREVGHFRRYYLSDLKQLLKASGFELRYSSYLFSILPIPIFIGRFLINPMRKLANQKSTGHVSKMSLLGKFFGFILKPEVNMVARRKSIPIGSSCLIVAQKTDQTGG